MWWIAQTEWLRVGSHFWPVVQLTLANHKSKTKHLTNWWKLFAMSDFWDSLFPLKRKSSFILALINTLVTAVGGWQFSLVYSPFNTSLWKSLTLYHISVQCWCWQKILNKYPFFSSFQPHILLFLKLCFFPRFFQGFKWTYFDINNKTNKTVWINTITVFIFKIKLVSCCHSKCLILHFI